MGWELRRGVAKTRLSFRLLGPRDPDGQPLRGPEPQRPRLPPPAAGETPPPAHTLTHTHTSPFTAEEMRATQRWVRVQRSRRGQTAHLTSRAEPVGGFRTAV